MVVICGGGSSGVNPTANAVVQVTAQVAGDLLDESLNPWLIAAIAFLQLPPLILSSLCGSDPPVMPTFTSAESSALTTSTLGSDFATGLVKLADVVTNLAWQRWCVCTSGALIVPPPITPPTGTPIPQLPVAPSTAACFVLHDAPLALVVPQSFARGGGPLGVHFDSIDATSLQVIMNNAIISGGGCTIQFDVNWQVSTPSFSTLHTQSFTLAPGATQTHTLPIYPGAQLWDFAVTATTGTGSSSAEEFGNVFCGGQLPGQSQSPCCPADAVTAASLDAILKMVTLIQRQIAPFGTIAGATHPGLTGSGQFAVSSIIGLSVVLTSVPSNIGATSGDPLEIFGAGWVNTGTANGWGPRQFIGSSPMLLELVSGDVTLVGYSLAPGVTATINELVREP
jgi:hypothetical protein